MPEIGTPGKRSLIVGMKKVLRLPPAIPEMIDMIRRPHL
jgi:hypothetical protein